MDFCLLFLKQFHFWVRCFVGFRAVPFVSLPFRSVFIFCAVCTYFISCYCFFVPFRLFRVVSFHFFAVSLFVFAFLLGQSSLKLRWVIVGVVGVVVVVAMANMVLASVMMLVFVSLLRCCAVAVRIGAASSSRADVGVRRTY